VAQPDEPWGHCSELLYRAAQLGDQRCYRVVGRRRLIARGALPGDPVARFHHRDGAGGVANDLLDGLR
jgi:hypothetical protein